MMMRVVVVEVPQTTRSAEVVGVLGTMTMAAVVVE